jgi:hypothetical protein
MDYPKVIWLNRNFDFEGSEAEQTQRCIHQDSEAIQSLELTRASS